jgi:hypothetical protein
MGAPFPFGSRGRPAVGPERPVDVFVRGLLSGAIVGAVIAGSAIWERRHRRRASEAAALPTSSPTLEAGAPDAVRSEA